MGRSADAAGSSRGDDWRVKRLRIVAVALVVLAATGCQSWVQYGHDARLTNFESGETTITPANVGTLTEAWTGSVPAGDMSLDMLSINASMVMVSAGSKLVGYSRSGTTNCSGSPKICTPVWIGLVNGNINGAAAVVGTTAYVASTDGILAALDLSGTTNCSGTPTTCTPLWTAPTSVFGSVTIADGKLFVQDHGANVVRVFDAAGVAGCTGSPKVCQPLWSSTTVTAWSGTPSVAGGVVYVGGDNGVYAFDEVGATNCSGTPTICAPLWHGAVGGIVRGGMTVSGGFVYVPVYVFVDGNFDHDTGRLVVFPAGTGSSCPGAPKECAPRWTADLAHRVEHTSPAIAHGFVYIGDTQGIHAYDAAGVQGCAGTPVVCTSRWSTAPVAGLRGLYQPTVAGDVLYSNVDSSGPAHHHLVAFDARGANGCTGTPSICPLLLDAPLLGNGVSEGWVLVADGVVFASAQTDDRPVSFGRATISAFRLP
jgi:hypothetical protein